MAIVRTSDGLNREHFTVARPEASGCCDFFGPVSWGVFNGRLWRQVYGGPGVLARVVLADS